MLSAILEVRGRRMVVGVGCDTYSSKSNWTVTVAKKQTNLGFCLPQAPFGLSRSVLQDVCLTYCFLFFKDTANYLCVCVVLSHQTSMFGEKIKDLKWLLLLAGEMIITHLMKLSDKPSEPKPPEKHNFEVMTPANVWSDDVVQQIWPLPNIFPQYFVL